MDIHYTKGILRPAQDAYGRAFLDFHEGRQSFVIIERDDGYFDTEGTPAGYFIPYNEWPKFERDAMAYARGRALDVGCGPGRVALHLQGKGQDVVAIDNSPLAVKVCRLRGVVDARVMTFSSIGRELGSFDTIVMWGNNFGLLENWKKGRTLLKQLHGLTSDTAKIIAMTLDPYRTSNACHHRYHERNRRRKRMGGQVRLRIRYMELCTPWFDYLFVSQDEMQKMLAGTGWEVERFFDSDGPLYSAVIRKD